jgi:orotidine-5'-phosphate decarboxylase
MSIGSAERIIVALDGLTPIQALEFTASISSLRWVKVGLELFLAGGAEVVTQMRNRNLEVFLDLKFHDIPATMAAACSRAAQLGAGLITVHGAAGLAGLIAAQQGAQAGALAADLPMPKLLAVTVLTSWDPLEFANQLAVTEPIDRYVHRLAKLSAQAGIAGCVCSPLDVASLRTAHPQPFALITPGIRPVGSDANDQQRVLSPAQALAAGANALVIGRPITKAINPEIAFAECCRSIEEISN